MIPSKVKVAGIEYQIIKKPYVKIGEDRNYRGKCDSNLGKIELAEGMGPDIEEQIFVHELVHACLDQAGYDEHDEDLVNRLGIVLHQVLKDNKLTF
ncbi:ImmA/IrrE family metallo-endopeptidase [Caldibacillus lycopersici]|uniref:ImmA/IrrE family metallo-endopeptidase n=1 Tax=Perspicuibacillus lycopersici TaxID=1325689 RepID=A0AAE3LMZ5_9BACI|nr:ImmA/IrrE family metallo-endopeptidase [Perspicuibacillus lycopersici]MCU9614095.1 ImmA/IrrE family metallo-endopeptidase [Perspicuibacillus lycopersici]